MTKPEVDMDVEKLVSSASDRQPLRHEAQKSVSQSGFMQKTPLGSNRGTE